VGADRLVNTVAAHERYKGALVVVDFGTATTFDVVSAVGNYEGGVIAPGVNVSAEALHLGAAMLPRVAIQRSQSVIGKDTVPADAVGPLLGLSRPRRRSGRAHPAEYGEPMTVMVPAGPPASSTSKTQATSIWTRFDQSAVSCSFNGAEHQNRPGAFAPAVDARLNESELVLLPLVRGRDWHETSTPMAAGRPTTGAGSWSIAAGQFGGRARRRASICPARHSLSRRATRECARPFVLTHAPRGS